MFEARFRTDKVYIYSRKTKEEKAGKSRIVEHKENKYIHIHSSIQSPNLLTLKTLILNLVQMLQKLHTLKSEGLVQTGDENWEYQLKLNDDEMSCLLEKWKTIEQ